MGSIPKGGVISTAHHLQIFNCFVLVASEVQCQSSSIWNTVILHHYLHRQSSNKSWIWCVCNSSIHAMGIYCWKDYNMVCQHPLSLTVRRSASQAVQRSSNDLFQAMGSIPSWYMWVSGLCVFVFCQRDEVNLGLYRRYLRTLTPTGTRVTVSLAPLLVPAAQ
jgi:hypothetical protein